MNARTPRGCLNAPIDQTQATVGVAMRWVPALSAGLDNRLLGARAMTRQFGCSMPPCNATSAHPISIPPSLPNFRQPRTMSKRPHQDEDEGDDDGPAAASAVAAAMEEEDNAPSIPALLPASQPAASAPPTHPCNAPGCRVVCRSAQDLEVHDAAAHRFACHECRGAFASQAILSRHLEEHHNPFFRVRAERGERVYGCLVDGCEGNFADSNARKLHCLAKHGFARNFDFEGVLGAAAPPPSRRRQAQQQQQHGGKARLTEEERAARAQDIRASGAPCRYYNTPRGCRRGERCFFRHERSAAADVDALSGALDRRLKLNDRHGNVSFGRQARGRSHKMEKPHPLSQAHAGADAVAAEEGIAEDAEDG